MSTKRILQESRILETISTGVVQRSWELAGWIRGKPVNRKLADIMAADYSNVDARNAVSQIYAKFYATRLSTLAELKKVL